MRGAELNDKCMNCSKELTKDEKALYKRICNRGATEYKCIKCCAEYFKVEEKLLHKKIQMFKDQGCTLFE